MSADLEANVEVVEDARGIAVIERYLGTAIYQNNKFPDWKSNHLTEGHERSDYDNYYYIIIIIIIIIIKAPNKSVKKVFPAKCTDLYDVTSGW